MGKYRKVPLNSLGTESKDLTRPDVRTIVDAAQGRTGRHIRLTMQPTRPSLAGAMRIIDSLGNPASAKFGGVGIEGPSHRIGNAA